MENIAVQVFASELRSVIPAPLHAAATLLPCPCNTSICRNFVTACSSFDPFLGIVLLVSGLILSHRLVPKRPVRSSKAQCAYRPYSPGGTLWLFQPRFLPLDHPGGTEPPSQPFFLPLLNPGGFEPCHWGWLPPLEKLGPPTPPGPRAKAIGLFAKATANTITAVVKIGFGISASIGLFIHKYEIQG